MRGGFCSFCPTIFFVWNGAGWRQPARFGGYDWICIPSLDAKFSICEAQYHRQECLIFHARSYPGCSMNQFVVNEKLEL